MAGTFGSGPVRSLAEVIPGLLEGSGSVGAKLTIQKSLPVALTPPLCVDGVTYKVPLFVAPCDGCMIKELWVTCAVKGEGGTNTLAFEKYDASGNAGANVLSATNFDPTTLTAKEGTKMTLSTTESNLLMDEGDVLWATFVTGTQSVQGEGYFALAIVAVPEIVV